VSRRPRLTVRARLTMLYTGLFAVCGAIVVAVSYILVARLEPPGEGRSAPAVFLARCRAEQLSAHPNARVLAKCNAYFQLQGAQHQRDLTLSHLLQYSLITLAVVIALAAVLGWIAAGRALRPVHRIAAAARAASEHAEHLIDALLVLARNERGLTVHEQVDLATVAEDVLDTANLDDLQVHATLEPAVISGDPVLAERLIANLVDNAVRYNAAAGDIWISTHTIAGSSHLTVANTGPLISPAEADRIFQPFQRLGDRTSHDGFGLGLTIVASIAAVHGGTAAAYPRNDGGLSIIVTIPRPGPRPETRTARRP
jgi:signal transduction histidine kinase